MWIAFVLALQRILAYVGVEPPFGHLVAFRDAVIAMAQSQDMRTSATIAFKNARERMSTPNQDPGTNPLNLVFMEMKAVPLVAASLEATSLPADGSKSAWKKAAAMASTVLGSVKEVVSETPYAKAVVSALKEATDIFR